MPTYHVVDGSHSGHCCFEASVVSSDRPSRRQDGTTAESPDGVAHLESICECFERRDADAICLALNKAESPRSRPPMNTEDAIQSVEKLNVALDDIAVVRLSEYCPPNLQHEIARQIADVMPDLQGRVVILPHGYEVATFKRDANEALQAWHDAWLSQGEGRVLSMVEAHRKTCRALGLEENT